MPSVAEDRGMGAFVAPRSAAPVLQERNKELNSWVTSEMPESIQKISDATKVFIFNVGPWQQQQYMGTKGKWIVPACPEGKEHSDPLVVAGIVTEHYPYTEKVMHIGAQEDGWAVAQSFLGIGAGMAPANSLKRYGVSVCRQWPPTKAEIKEAWKNLDDGELSQLIREANGAAAQGPNALEQVLTPRHFEAARLKKLTTVDCPWMGRSIATTERVECQFCGEPMKRGLSKCPHCHEVTDRELYAKQTGQKQV